MHPSGAFLIYLKVRDNLKTADEADIFRFQKKGKRICIIKIH